MKLTPLRIFVLIIVMGAVKHFILPLIAYLAVLAGIFLILLIPFFAVSSLMQVHRIALTSTMAISLIVVAVLLFALAFFILRIAKTPWDGAVLKDLMDWKLWAFVVGVIALADPVGKLFGITGEEIKNSLGAIIPAWVALKAAQRMRAGSLQNSGRENVSKGAENSGEEHDYVHGLTMSGSDPIIIDADRKLMKYIVVMFAGFDLVLLGMIVFSSPSGISGNLLYLLILIAVIALPITVPTIIYSIINLINKAPAFVVNQEGITDNATYYSVGLIKWKKIAGIFPDVIMGQTVLSINLVDKGVFFSQLNPVKRLLHFSMEAFNLGKKAPINIPEIRLMVPLGDLLRIMPKYLDAEDKMRIQFGLQESQASK